MDFIEQVNQIKNNVLERPEYKTPIETMLDKANEYKVESYISQSQSIIN